jgi:hypothetical protein
MKDLHMVYIEFKDGSIEGVTFTEKEDAIFALRGGNSGSTLALAWHDLYGDDNDLEMKMKEIKVA